ncbi:MAG TPA: hypothetical protein PLU21_00030 [Candidatus Saccharibacteria bacterium]|nr:hypothetical protein [Candidatus Saccharibacteria bacterium]
MEPIPGFADDGNTPQPSIDEQTALLLDKQASLAKLAKRYAEAQQAAEEVSASNDDMLREELADAAEHLRVALETEAQAYDFMRMLLADAMADAVEAGAIKFDEAVSLLETNAHLTYCGEPATLYEDYIATLATGELILITLPDEPRQKGMLNRGAVLVPKCYGGDEFFPVARLHFVGKTFDDIEEVILERNKSGDIESPVRVLPVSDEDY